MHTRDADVYETILIMIRRHTLSKRIDLEVGEGGEGGRRNINEIFPRDTKRNKWLIQRR